MKHTIQVLLHNPFSPIVRKETMIRIVNVLLVISKGIHWRDRLFMWTVLAMIFTLFVMFLVS